MIWFNRSHSRYRRFCYDCLALSIFSPAQATPAQLCPTLCRELQVFLILCISFFLLSRVGGPVQVCQGLCSAGPAAGRSPHGKSARSAEWNVTAGAVTSPLGVPGQTVDNALHTGVLGSPNTWGRRSPLSPGWGRQLAVWGRTHKARGGLACGASYTHLPNGRHADDARTRVHANLSNLNFFPVECIVICLHKTIQHHWHLCRCAVTADNW